MDRLEGVPEEMDGFGAQVSAIIGEFDGFVTAASNNSASPAAAGSLPASAMLMQNERQARESLVQYLSKTREGLLGYHTAVSAIGREYQGQMDLSVATMRALLKPNDAPVPNDVRFDWQDVLARPTAPTAGG